MSEIQPLLSNMTAHMNSNDIAKDRVKVSVLATAVMRIVDTSTASVIYQNVRTTITNNGSPSSKWALFHASIVDSTYEII